MSQLLLPEVDVAVPADGFPIGEAAAIVGLTVEALRYYEREGLLLDPAPRDAGNRRRYFRSDLSWIAGLIMLRETGMTITDIRTLAELSRQHGTEEERLVFLSDHRRRILAQLDRTQKHLALITLKIEAYENLTAQERNDNDEDN